MNPLFGYIPDMYYWPKTKCYHGHKDYSKDNNPNLTYITDEKGNVIKVLRNRRNK